MIVNKFGPVLLNNFRVYLLKQEYSPDSANNLVGVFKTLLAWMSAHKINFKTIAPNDLNQFLIYRKKMNFTCWLTKRMFIPILGFLSLEINLNIKFVKKKLLLICCWMILKNI